MHMERVKRELKRAGAALGIREENDLGDYRRKFRRKARFSDVPSGKRDDYFSGEEKKIITIRKTIVEAKQFCLKKGHSFSLLADFCSAGFVCEPETKKNLNSDNFSNFRFSISRIEPTEFGETSNAATF